MKLWIDDIRTPPSDDWVWVKTYAQAIEALLGEDVVTEISFDHDLGDGQGEEEKTGAHVARWVEARAAEGNISKIKWKIHSANPVGRKNIEETMKSAERLWKK